MNELSFLPDEPWVLEPVKLAITTAEKIGEADFLGLKLGIYDDAVFPRFIVSQVCRILGLKRLDDQIQKVPENHKTLRLVAASSFRDKRPREAWMVDEAGLYQLVFQSRKPQAVEFREYVFASVLPTLRRHGQFPPPDIQAPLRVPPQLTQWCPQDDDFRRLCVRQQILVAERLAVVAEIEAAPHRSLMARCRDVETRLNGRTGFARVSVYRFHRKWCASGRNWRALKCGTPPGRTPQRLLANCCETKEAA